MNRRVGLAALFLLFLLFSLTGCGSETSPETDALTPADQTDSRADLPGTDSVTDIPTTDVGTDLAADLGNDMAQDQFQVDAPVDVADDIPSDQAETDLDVVTPTHFEAVPGARCTPSNRIGTVSVGTYSFSSNAEASAVIYDRTDAWAPDVSLSDQACIYFKEKPVAFCDTCTGDTLCAPDGVCQPQPVPATDVVLTLTAGAQSQDIVPQAGGTWGTVTLPGLTFAAEVKWAGLSVSLSQTTIPDELANLAGTLTGGYDQPTAADITWTAPAEGGLLFTHIPINHHAGGPTYTECAVDATSGSLHIDGAMLKPLSVSTGLEFQGVDHIRFAAATTPTGCIEFRFHHGQYVDLMQN